MVVPIGSPGQWPLFGDRPGLFEGAVALEVRPVTTHERRHRLGPRQREASRQPPESPPEPRRESGLAGNEPIEHQAPAFRLVALQDAIDGVLRTIVSTSTKQSTRPGRWPRLQRCAPRRTCRRHTRPVARRRQRRTSRRSPQSASSLSSSATTISKEVSGSQRLFRETPETRATLARIASRASPISASSFRAGITKERRRSVIASENPAGDDQRADR